MPDQELNPFQAPISLDSLEESLVVHINSKRAIWIFTLLALVPIGPLLLIMKFSHASRDWNPTWDSDMRIMIFGTAFGMLLSSRMVGKALSNKLIKPGFWRATLYALIFGFAWGMAALLGWGWTMAVHGAWIGDLSSFRAEINLDEIVGGLLALSAFIAIPLCMFGTVLIRLFACRTDPINQM